MSIIKPSKETGTTRGSGPKKSVCLLLVKNGLGDAMHCLPTIWQMAQDGFAVTVYCRPFHAPIYEAIEGVTVRVPFDGELSPGWMESAEEKYERILDFPHWGGWECSELGENVRPQMEQFADLCDVVLPESFSWIDALNPERSFAESYVLFAPESTEVWRSLSDEKAQEVFSAISSGHSVKWLSTKRELTNEMAFRQLVEVAEERYPDCDWRKVMAEGAWLKDDFDAREQERLSGKTVCADVRELINVIYNAQHIVTAESGVSNIAGALGCDMAMICSVTDPEQIVGQYRRYHSLSYANVRGHAPEMTCSAPCWRHPKNGFTDGKCCGTSDAPICLNAIQPEQILETLPLLIGA